VIPEELHYTDQHEWVSTAGATVRVGITHYAQQALGGVVLVSLPMPGTAVVAGEPLGEVESTKVVADIFAPVSGTVRARNDELNGSPELVNSDPYGAGWLVEIEPTDPDAVGGLLDAAAYKTLTEES
jgi:glycine cleavage system H protein